MDEKELIEHKIVVDDYVELKLKIPKVLTPIELKSLMVKANKIFNISDVPIVAPKKTPVKNGYGNYPTAFTPEKDALLFKLKKNNTPWAKISERMDMPKQKLFARKSYLQSRNRWNSKLLEAFKE